jgi:hypothetical protein
MDLFKNACRIHLESFILHYLRANAYGHENGAAKALCHVDLCKFYVATFHGCTEDSVRRDHEDEFMAVHDATQALTDYLDERIGFPMSSDPDYEKLIPLFFDKFHDLALAVYGKGSQ